MEMLKSTVEKSNILPTVLAGDDTNLLLLLPFHVNSYSNILQKLNEVV